MIGKEIVPNFYALATRELAEGKYKKVGFDGTVVWREGVVPIKQSIIEARASELRADYEAKEYQRLRKYPPIGEQLAMIYDTIASGKPLDKNSAWFKTIKAEKERVPKPDTQKKGLVKKIVYKITNKG